MRLSDDVRSGITRAAQENGFPVEQALAVAERESSFDVNGRAPGSSAFGLFQMLKKERDQYGGNSYDPHEQADAWMRYIAPVKAEMATRLGRDPTGPELYIGHYVGGGRAARMVSGQIAPETPVQDVFTPQELAANPNFARAGTAGALSSSILSDMDRRIQKYAPAGEDLGAYGTAAPPAAPEDLASYGTAVAAPGAPAPPEVKPVNTPAASPADVGQSGQDWMQRMSVGAPQGVA